MNIEIRFFKQNKSLKNINYTIILNDRCRKCTFDSMFKYFFSETLHKMHIYILLRLNNKNNEILIYILIKFSNI